ncbi:MAG: signal recognition particle-docking protein FtsY [Myxococcota bacterium]
MAVDWQNIIFLGGFIAVFLAFVLLFIKKSRARRREMFGEEPTPRVFEEVPTAESLPAKTEPSVQPPAPLPPPDELDEIAEPALPPAEQAEAPTAPIAKLSDEALQLGLAKTSESLLGKLNKIFARQSTVEPALLDDLEEALLTADVGVGLTTRFIDGLRDDVKAKKITQGNEVQGVLRQRMLDALKEAQNGRDAASYAGKAPQIILFVGVNGVGKTTTIGKIASQMVSEGKNVVLAAADTFRAAAVEQLEIWGQRTGAKVIRGADNSDPASVVFNAVQHAVDTGADIVLADTAGRLHTKTELMDEIKKVKRAASKARVDAPDETWLVVDATTGQNAVQQAKEFHQTLTLSGVILTKLDGTAKGGVVIAIADALKIPVKFVGVGEQAADLRPFDPQTFINAIFAE